MLQQGCHNVTYTVAPGIAEHKIGEAYLVFIQGIHIGRAQFLGLWAHHLLPPLTKQRLDLMYTAGALLTSWLSLGSHTSTDSQGAMRDDPIEQLMLQMMGAYTAERVSQGRHGLRFVLRAGRPSTPTRRSRACLPASLVRRLPRTWASLLRL